MTTVLSFIFLHLFLLSRCDGWSYQDQDSWPGLCQTGKRQSPIPLYHASAIKDRFERLELTPGYYQEQEIVISNNGNSVTLKLAKPDKVPAIYGGDLGTLFVLDTVHFHWPAEHTTDGLRRSLSAGFRHYNAKYSNISRAEQHKDGLASFNVPFNITEEDNPLLASIIESISDIKSPNTSAKLKKPLKLKDLFPSNKNQYFRYNGSVPIPDCTENMVYTVFDTTVNLSRAQLEILTNITNTNDVRMRSPSRYLQDTNGREVYYTLL